MKKSVRVAGDTFTVSYDGWFGEESGVPSPEAFVAVNGTGMLVFSDNIDRMIVALREVKRKMSADAAAAKRRPAPKRPSRR